MPDKETPEKKSKIIQVITTDHGRLLGVLYANGRVFFWTYTKLPGEKEPGEGVLVGDDVSGFRNKTDIRLILVDLGCPSPKLRAHLKSADSLLGVRAVFTTCEEQLEGEFQGELNDAGIAGREDLAEVDRIREEGSADLIEISVIEDIGGLGAELRVEAFADTSVLEERRVPAPSAWPEDGIARGVAGANALRGRIGENGGIEPLGDGVRRIAIGIGELVGASVAGIVAGEVREAETGRIYARADRGEPKTGLRVSGARNLPTAKKVACQTVLRTIEGKQVDIAAVENVAAIVFRGTIFGVKVVDILRSVKLIRDVGQRVRPGVVEDNDEILAGPLLQLDLQRMVVGIEGWNEEVDGVVAAIGADVIQ